MVSYKGRERRQFKRTNFATPLAYKVCKRKTLSKLFKGYTTNMSRAGLLCNIKDKVKKGDVLWLSFDRSTMYFCQEMDKKSMVYQNGVIGKVVRIKSKKNHTFDVGIQFIIREEKNLTNIYPKIHFMKNLKESLGGEDENLDLEEPIEEPLEEPEEISESEEELDEED